jgi:hypothetical protein
VSQPLKEFVMNKPQVEVVELGDAKEQTKGAWFKPLGEVHPAGPTRDPIPPA